MAREFLRTMLTPSVRDAQRRAYGRSYPDLGTEGRTDALGIDEQDFLAARDSVYVATVTENGWPYVQHRGGHPGFLVARSPQQLAFADFGGNRQLITVGSLAKNDRMALFAMDYAARTRLKVIGHARVVDAGQAPDLVAATAPPGGHAATPERFVLVEVVSFDWNCPKFITPRFSAAEVAGVVDPLRARIAELEARLASAGRGEAPRP